MEKLTYDLAIGVLGGVLTSVLAYVTTRQWSLIQSWFDKEIRRQAQLIEGKWETSEVFGASNSQSDYILDIRSKGRRISGILRGLTGPDQGTEFDVEGTFKDLIVTFMWTAKGPRALESGTITAKLVRDGELEGHGLYIEPSDGKVYTSDFKATYKP